MKKLPMKDLIRSRVKSGEGRSGYFLEVSQPLPHFNFLFIGFHLSADKSMAILLGRPICLRDEDCTVHFPKELDDE